MTNKLFYAALYLGGAWVLYKLGLDIVAEFRAAGFFEGWQIVKGGLL